MLAIRIQVICLFLILSGCSISREAYFEPVGEGKIWGARSVDEYIYIAQDASHKIMLRARPHGSMTTIWVYIPIERGSTMQFVEPDIHLQCAGETPQKIKMPKWEVHMITNGYGRFAYYAATDVLNGKSFEKRVPEEGDVHTGIHSLEISFSSCANSNFDLRLPAYLINGELNHKSPVKFIRKEGVIISFPSP